jgi:thiamine biosynthesis protein ThiS
MAAIGILVNGEPRELPAEVSVAELLNELALPERRIAVELNGSVVSRADWAKIVVKEGDKLEIVHFVGGG